MIRHKEMLFVDFPNMGEITAESKANNDKRVFTGGVRIGNGKYRTDEQVREYKERSLKRQLP